MQILLIVIHQSIRIAWALHDREVAKRSAQGDENAKALTKLGDSIDKYIREMQCGETLGIPQGSEVFDFIAEIVLAYADSQLKKALEEKKLKVFGSYDIVMIIAYLVIV